MAVLAKDVMTRSVVSPCGPVQHRENPRLPGIVSRLGVYDRPDDDIRTQIEEQVIEGAFLLDSLAIAVTVVGGVVTLPGPVPPRPCGAERAGSGRARGRRRSRPGLAQLSATLDGSVHSA